MEREDRRSPRCHVGKGVWIVNRFGKAVAKRMTLLAFAMLVVVGAVAWPLPVKAENQTWLDDFWFVVEYISQEAGLVPYAITYSANVAITYGASFVGGEIMYDVYDHWHGGGLYDPWGLYPFRHTVVALDLLYYDNRGYVCSVDLAPDPRPGLVRPDHEPWAGWNNSTVVWLYAGSAMVAGRSEWISDGSTIPGWVVNTTDLHGPF
jgi:hypothetical protein